jgi:hypothetical protein
MTSHGRSEMEKRYQHDCDQCVFLGQWNEYDLYFCGEQGDVFTTVIARYGNEGCEYSSGLVFGKQGGKDNPLYHALKIATELALYHEGMEYGK